MADKNDKETIGVILLNLGGPDSLQAVKPFLYNLFSDRGIIRLGPSFLQKPIAWLISAIRSKKTEKLYSLIGRKSPILDITMAQAKALEKALNNELEVVAGVKFKVFVGMRYWHPLIEEAVQEICAAGIKKIIVLGLYPQYSVATTGSSISKFKEVISKYQVDVSYIESWFNHPMYIEALVDVIKKGLDAFKAELKAKNLELGTESPSATRRGENSKLKSSLVPGSQSDIHVLFSAHSLPQKFIAEGDPYVTQIQGTINEITKKINIKWHLSYQSKSGPVKWLEPSTDEKIRELAAAGIRNILAVPISFVSDHIETLYEIDILYKRMAEELGINLIRTESLNTHHLFIRALKEIVVENVKGLTWLK